jgi:uncharacterized protein YacL
MTCTSCSIAVIFICAMLYISFMIDKCSLSASFIDTLSKPQQLLYQDIIKERKIIYFVGIVIGLILSFLYMKISPREENKLYTICSVVSITFLTAYFVYIFYPKKQTMILELDDRVQREEWHSIYKKMQYHYHMGLLIGILFIIIFNV